MALAPFQDEKWAALWPRSASTDLSLPELIELINRRFRGKPVPPTMPSSASRSIWKDVSVEDTSREQLIRLLNRRLGGVRIPMTEDALVVVDPVFDDPIGSETIVMAGIHNNTYHIGAPVNFTSGVVGNAWEVTTKRYARRVSSGSYHRINDQLDPRALIDPRYPGPGYNLRARECAVVVAALAAGAGTYTGLWGFGGMPNAYANTDNNFFPFVGFRMYFQKNASNAIIKTNTWHCRVADDNLATLYDVDTGIASDVPHELQLVFQGGSKTVVFYVDGVQRGSYAFATNTAPGQQTPYPLVGTAAGAMNMLFAANMGGTTTGTNLYYHMSPATPLVTFEYDDT